MCEIIKAVPLGEDEIIDIAFRGAKATMGVGGWIKNEGDAAISIRCRHKDGRTDDHALSPGQVLSSGEEEVEIEIL